MKKGLRCTATVMVFLLGLALTLPATAQRIKEARSSLDHVTFARPELRVPETLTDAELLRDRLPNMRELDRFRAEHGADWRFTVDERRGRVALVDGGAIPFLPGHANDLKWENFDSRCRSNACLSQAKVEALARQFMADNVGAFKIDPADLLLDSEGTTAVGESIYLLRFQWTYHGIPVDRGSVYFRINGGNLIQVGTENIGPISLDPTPAFGADTAWENLRGYMGNLWSGQEKVLDAGSLVIVPVTPKDKDPNLFTGPLGSQIDYRLVYRLVFKRPGVIGTFEALVDAHDGEIVTLRDTNKYGHVHGGVYTTDGFPPEADRPFPFADIGGGLYSDEGGNFAGNNATTTLVGKYTHITDDCGAISNVTTTGDVDFGLSAGTDCTNPTPNNGGAGNTHSARTLFYMATMINIKARSYLPTNTWLNTSYITCHVNQPAYCNASSGGGTINFYKKTSSCNNLGEIPGVALHEWGHSMDDYDGSGGDSPPVETRADWTATLQTHDSCTGRGAFVTGNCDGYGDACTNCSGIRDADRTKHTNTAPWTAANGQGTVYDCGGAGSYNGPCGWEDHCESGISTQALWELVNTDLPALSSMDVTSAWVLNDRFFYTSMPTLGNMYTCTPPTSNGCGAGSIYTTYRAIDDTGDGTANGTPHAAAIFSALNRHNIACGAVGDATNQNQTSCPSLAKVVATGTPGSNSVNLSWGAITNATRYFVFRNDTDCNAGFTLIATVTAPTTTYTDPSATNGLTSFYRVQAAAASDSCTGPMSDCVTVTPAPCAGSVILNKSIYNCADTVSVSMVDSNVPGDPATVTVTAWSTTDATVKTITLNRTSFGNYAGSFTTTSGAAGATQVRVADGATITVRYLDVDYCGTANVNVDATASADCAVPIITNVHSTVAGTIVHILWTTNEAANSYVVYDTAFPPSASNMSDAALVTSHDLLLPALTPCTDYYFYVRSTDIAGNQATDNNGGNYYTFTTGQNVMPTYAYSGAAVPIPDNTTVSAPIAVPDNKTVQNITVTVTNITHTFDGDITLALVGPDATSVNLSVRHGSSGDNYINTVFDDTATTPIASGTAPFTGSFKPDQPLSAFVGKNALGNWTLQVTDSASGDTGTINGWSITFTYPAQGCGPSLAYDSNTWTSACSAGGPGNGDTIIDAGEDVSITPVVTNNGTATTTNVQATLSCSTPGVTITTGAGTFGTLNAGASAPSAAPFVIHVSTSVACGTQLDFTLHMTCTEKPAGYDGYFSLVVGQVIPGGAQVVFQENFDAVTPPALPAGWTTETITGNPWVTYGSYSCSTPNQLNYPYTSSAAANAWVYTPGLSLLAGVTYTLNFNDRVASSSYPENLSVWAGTTANHTTQTIPIWSQTGIVATTCTNQVPTFTVPADGTYYIGFHCTSAADMWRMIVDDVKVTYEQAAACNMNVCASATCNLTCTASAAPATGQPPLTVNFTATATPTGCLETPTFSWTFGDGATSTTQNPSHQYADLGTYTWTLDVTADGQHCSQTGTISVVPPCTMSCTASATPTSGNTPLTVQFTSTVTSANCAGTPTFAWTFGDGTTSTAQNPSHIYTTTTATTFTWSLTVTLNGVTCTKNGSIAVSTYDVNLFDDNGNGRICIDSQGGKFKYTILRGKGIGTYTGQGSITWLNGVLTLITPATSPYAVTAKYDRIHKKGSASITIKATRVSSTITDNNTTNNPPGC